MTDDAKNGAVRHSTVDGGPSRTAEEARENDQARFQCLVRQWKDETLYLSSVTDMAMHPAYQGIIAMGKDAAPWLLEELRREPDHWFLALQAMTGQDPVPPADQGNVAKMAEAWLRYPSSSSLSFASTL